MLDVNPADLPPPRRYDLAILRRRALILASTFAALTALACAGLALYGLFHADVAYVRVGKHELAVASNEGSLYLLLMPARMMDGQRFKIYHGPSETLGRGAWGFRYNGGTFPGTRFVGVPMVLPALLCALIAVLLLRRARRGPIDPAFCRVCGYDLRASPQRCPECGTAVTAGATSPVQAPAAVAAPAAADG